MPRWHFGGSAIARASASARAGLARRQQRAGSWLVVITPEALAAAGISLAVVTQELEAEGVDKFAASFRSLLSGIDAKAGALAS